MTKILVKIIINRSLWLLLEFNPHDCWIGAYWVDWVGGTQDIWICIIPMLPIHIMRFNYE